jgi:hypothetical protein
VIVATIGIHTLADYSVWLKDRQQPSSHKVHVVEHSFDSSDDESSDVLTSEFVWPSKDKSLTSDVLKPIHQNRQDDIKYTFDVAKGDMIF